MFRIWALALVSSASLTSCAIEMDSQGMWSDLRGGSLEFAAGRAEFRGPVKLGVAPPLRVPSPRWTRERDAQFEAWTDEERAVVARWTAKFEERKIVEKVVYLPRLLISASEGAELMPALRAAARSAGVDAVLVTLSLTDIREQANVLAVLDLSLVGMFLFPGHHGKAVTVAEAVVFDVATNRIYAFAEGQGEAETMTALAYLNRKELTREARLASLDRLGCALFDEVVGLDRQERSARR